MSNRRAFTLIETLVAIAIMVMLAVVVVFSLAHKKGESSLDADVLKVKTVLAEARSDTLSGKEASAYGVHFGTDTVTLFKGTTYSSTSPDNELFQLNDDIEISSISLAGGGSDLVFRRLTGATDTPGSITLQIKTDSAKTATITVNAVGTVE